jgi:hypothetical protein
MSEDKEAVGRWSINTKALWEDFGFKVIPKESMPPDLVTFIEDYLKKLTEKYDIWTPLQFEFINCGDIGLLAVCWHDVFGVDYDSIGKGWQMDKDFTKEVLTWALAHEFGHTVFMSKLLEPENYPDFPPLPPNVTKLPEEVYERVGEEYADTVAYMLTGIPSGEAWVKKVNLLLKVGKKPPDRVAEKLREKKLL